MFEVHGHLPSSATTQVKMPVDYAAYLLSSSPPGFEFYTLRDHFAVGLSSGPGIGSRRKKLDSLKPILFANNNNNHVIEEDSECTGEPVSPGPVSPCSCSSPESPQSPTGKLRKKVSFADDLGLALTSVKILTENPDTPPRIRQEIIAKLTHGVSPSVSTDAPPLELNFKQPASDYLEFRERLEKDCVSLENVILKDYNVIGTIKVKNIGFEKNVFVRVTFDSWESNVDLSATYSTTGSMQNGPYDTFSFEISVPTDMDIKKQIQFAVGFETEGRQFWDNNNGLNYVIVSALWKSTSHCAKNESFSSTQNRFGEQSDMTWSLYSHWNNFDNNVPYY